MHRHFGNRHEHHSRHGWGGHMRDHLRGHRGGHREGRIGRLLEHGDLRFVILALVAEKPRHGYEVMRELEERTGGAYRPSPGVIYPTFSLLEDEGFVRQVGDEGGAHSSGARPKLQRAMQNLGVALGLRMQRGDVTEEMVDAIAAAIDEAAAKIERI
jgi:DNA-binding PadR family transcriptional regulator